MLAAPGNRPAMPIMAISNPLLALDVGLLLISLLPLLRKFNKSFCSGALPISFRRTLRCYNAAFGYRLHAFLLLLYGRAPLLGAVRALL